MSVRAIAALILLAPVTAPVMAHHNFAAEFDHNRPVCLKGTISRLDWVNPHIYIYLDVPDAAGKTVTWALESGGPAALNRTGWTRDTFKVGDHVAIGGFVAKNGTNRGSAQHVRPLVQAPEPAQSMPPDPADSAKKKEAEKMLTNSPWARTAVVPFLSDSQPRRGGRAGAGLYSGETKDDDPAQALLNAPTIRVTVRWQSALPVQEMLARSLAGEDASLLPLSRKPLPSAASEKYYWIAVTGVPVMADTFGPGRYEKALLAATSLAAKGRDPIRPDGVNVDPVGTSLDIVFLFSRSADFSADDGDIEFSMPFGKDRLKQKFHLKDMKVEGRNAL